MSHFRQMLALVLPSWGHSVLVLISALRLAVWFNTVSCPDIHCLLEFLRTIQESPATRTNELRSLHRVPFSGPPIPFRALSDVQAGRLLAAQSVPRIASSCNSRWFWGDHEPCLQEYLWFQDTAVFQAWNWGRLVWSICTQLEQSVLGASLDNWARYMFFVDSELSLRQLLMTQLVISQTNQCLSVDKPMLLYTKYEHKVLTRWCLYRNSWAAIGWSSFQNRSWFWPS